MKTIIEMAREADGIMLSDSEIFGLGFEFEMYQLERFAELVRAEAQADEREACAKVCEAHGVQFYSYSETAGECYSLAAAIRARGNA